MDAVLQQNARAAAAAALPPITTLPPTMIMPPKLKALVAQGRAPSSADDIYGTH